MPTARPTNGRVSPLRRLVISVMAPEGCGKTHWVTTMPKPIRLFSIDQNTEPTILRAFGVEDAADLDPEVCQFYQPQYPIVGVGTPEKQVQQEAEAAWYLIEDAIRDVYEGKANPMPRSIVFDSGTLLHRLNELRTFGRTEAIPPAQRMRLMGMANKDFTGFLDMCQRSGRHVALTHRAKPRWEDVEKRTSRGIEMEPQIVPGVWDRVGFREVGNLTNCEILLKFDAERGGKVANKFGCQILQTRQRPAVIGMEYWGKVDGVSVASFGWLATQLFPGTELADWE
jgi:hypothetical protein